LLKGEGRGGVFWGEEARMCDNMDGKEESAGRQAGRSHGCVVLLSLSDGEENL